MTEENFKDILMPYLEKPKDQKPFILALITGECTVGKCVHWAKIINQVSDIIER